VDESLEPQSQHVEEASSELPPELPAQRYRRFLLVFGILVLIVIGSVVYYKILTGPVVVPELVNAQPTPTAAVPTPAVYDVTDLMTYTLLQNWTTEQSEVVTSLKPVTVIGHGIRIYAPHNPAFSQVSSVTIAITRYPQSMTRLNSMQDIVNKMQSLYPKAYKLEQTTFAGQQAIHFWGDEKLEYEQYVVQEHGSFDYLWYIDVLYLGTPAEVSKLKETFTPQVSQILKSINFK
jgi:hypothetical protein